MLGASFAVHELDAPYGPAYAHAYTRDVAALTSELAFKMSTLRPVDASLNFTAADRLVSFAQAQGMKVRAHTLIWNDNQPLWLKRLRPVDVERLFNAHLLSTIGRYRGKIWAWDVVNEPLAPWDGQAGNLRKGPYLAAMGEDYIVRAFRAARAYDKTALLVLNEAHTETADDNGKVFRESLLALLKRLKNEGTPIDAVGLQSHLSSAKRYDMARFTGFIDEIAALGYAVHITECDVDDSAFEGSIGDRDRQVADLYAMFLNPVLAHRAVKALTFWQLADHTSWIHYRAKQRGQRPLPRPLLLDQNFNRKPAWYAVADALKAMPPR